MGNVYLTVGQVKTRDKLRKLLRLYGLDLAWFASISAYGVLNEEGVRTLTIHLRDLTAAHKGLYAAHKGDSNLTCPYKQYAYRTGDATSQYLAYHDAYALIRTFDNDTSRLYKGNVEVIIPGHQIRFPKIRELYEGKFD